MESEPKTKDESSAINKTDGSVRALCASVSPHSLNLHLIRKVRMTEPPPPPFPKKKRWVTVLAGLRAAFLRETVVDLGWWSLMQRERERFLENLITRSQSKERPKVRPNLPTSHPRLPPPSKQESSPSPVVVSPLSYLSHTLFGSLSQATPPFPFFFFFSHKQFHSFLYIATFLGEPKTKRTSHSHSSLHSQPTSTM